MVIVVNRMHSSIFHTFRQVSLTAILICSVFCLTGCGAKGDPELIEFKNTMNTFFEDVAEIDAQLNALDPESEGAVEEMLVLLDELDAKCAALAEIEIPDEFYVMSEYPDNIHSNMSKAVENFHIAFSNDAYNEIYKDVADGYYSRANTRIHDMILLLHGELPTGDDITITTEEDESS